MAEEADVDAMAEEIVSPEGGAMAAGGEVEAQSEDMMGGTPDDDSIEAEGVAADVGDGNGSPWSTNPLYRTRNNSPTRTPSKSAVWETVKRLSTDHPKVAEGLAHICTEAGCGYFFKLSRPTPTSWATTRVGEHLSKAHGATSGKNGVERAEANQVMSFNIFRVIMR